jgi:hypothetical protein
MQSAKNRKVIYGWVAPNAQGVTHKFFYCNRHAHEIPQLGKQLANGAVSDIVPYFPFVPCSTQSQEGRLWASARASSAAVAAAIATADTEKQSQAHSAIAALVSALSVLLDVAPTPGLRHTSAVAALMDLVLEVYACDTAAGTAAAGGNLAACTPAGAAAAAAAAAERCDMWAKWRECVQECDQRVLREVAALHRLDLSLARRLLLFDVDQQVLVKNNDIELQQRILAAKMHALRALLSKLLHKDPTAP